jgi:hypothetical protein
VVGRVVDIDIIEMNVDAEVRRKQESRDCSEQVFCIPIPIELSDEATKAELRQRYMNVGWKEVTFFFGEEGVYIKLDCRESEKPQGNKVNIQKPIKGGDDMATKIKDFDGHTLRDLAEKIGSWLSANPTIEVVAMSHADGAYKMDHHFSALIIYKEKA